jgi:NAD(P)-dependent dehydrogenase (short-subunit alcohol dehydrogenase family)
MKVHYRDRWLSGRVALVTGGAGGIGRAVSAALSAMGVEVGCLDVHPNGDTGVSIACDVTDERAVAAAFDQVERELGPLNLLVCAAGVVSEHAISELPLEQWRRVVDVSLTGTYLAIREAVPRMLAAGGGSIVAYSSGYGRTGYRRGAHYAAAKAGVEALVKSAALELADAGIRVNAIAPGPVATPFVGQVAEDLDAWRSARAEHIPMGRVAEPDDMVGPTLFLLGSDSRYVTGQVMHVNGGLIMP